MRIIVDRTKCQGHGMCEAMEPDFFEVGEDGTLRILDDSPAEERVVDVEAAINSCPALALTLQR